MGPPPCEKPYLVGKVNESTLRPLAAWWHWPLPLLLPPPQGKCGKRTRREVGPCAQSLYARVFSSYLSWPLGSLQTCFPSKGKRKGLSRGKGGNPKVPPTSISSSQSKWKFSAVGWINAPCPTKTYLPWSLEPVNMFSHLEKDFVGIIKDLAVGILFWIIWMTLRSKQIVFIRGRQEGQKRK